jgi:hypothetical protein
MKKKERKPKTTSQSIRPQTIAEKQAVKKFFAELQIAVDKVEWGRVRVPRLVC